MTTPEPPQDIMVLAADNHEITLTSGLKAQVVPLNLRELLRLLKIITNGGGQLFQSMDMFAPGMDENEFGGKFIALVIMAIPNAEEEAVDFIRGMVRPVGLVTQARTNQDRFSNDALWTQLRGELDNPQLEDTLSIIEAVVQREAGHIQSLGKRLSSMLSLARRTGQLPSTQSSSSGSPSDSSTSTPPSTPATSSVATPEYSTSSPSSTDGTTIGSSPSPSPV